MAQVTARRARVARSQSRERIANFVPQAVKAPFLLRCAAALIDYLFAVMIPVISLLLGRLAGYDGAKLLGSELSNAGWLAAVVLGLTNIILLPMFAGQSIGKGLLGIRIVRIDGGTASYKTIALRQTLGYLLTIASFGIGLAIALMSSKGRALHDYLSNTVVISAEKRPKVN